MRTVFACITVVLAATLVSPAIAQDETARPNRAQNANAFVERMLNRDTNGDGQLTPDEVPERMAERLFSTADTDGSGFLDRDELTRFAETRGQAGARRDRQPADRDRSAGPSFDASMRQAGRALRGLRASAFDASTRSEDLTAVQTLQGALIAAKSEITSVPMSAKAREQSGDDAATYQKSLRAEMIKTITETLVLETALNDGDTEAAKASLDRVLELRNKNHGVYQQEEHAMATPLNWPVVGCITGALATL